MSSLTLGSHGIGDTGSGNVAYISGLVMMDVMMRFVKLDRCVVAAGTISFIFRCFLLGDSRRDLQLHWDFE